jgi:hypothetical protein
MNKTQKWWWFILLILMVFGCKKQTQKKRIKAEHISFCYWNTSFNLDTVLYNSVGINHFYIRCFDVDWDPASEEAKPIASIRTHDSMPCRFTPTVFLTNKVFEKSSKKQLQVLSSRIKKRIKEITVNFGEPSYSDVLIDCDWTVSTKEKFFYFVRCLKNEWPDKMITVTLRLWQYKQRKPDDIPPVDRCLLMCYNMQMVNDFQVNNSIASMAELKKYISGDTYPLPLDVALPAFNWAILFRNEKFAGLLGHIDKKQYANNFIEYSDVGKGRYRAIVDKVESNFFIRKGDIVRIEEVSPDELLQMAQYLKSKINMDDYSRVTFFSWNKSYINNLGINEIKNIYSAFFE